MVLLLRPRNSKLQSKRKITLLKSPLREFRRFGSGFDGVAGDSEEICLPWRLWVGIPGAQPQNISQELNRLRKKDCLQTKRPKNIPQGLKAC
jgi:hypothetical protein